MQGVISVPIIRHRHGRNFTIIPNEIFNDSNLRIRDIGLLCYLLHLPDEWVFSVAGLIKSLPHDKKDGITASLKRLESAGYLRRSQSRREKGKLSEAVWTVSDTPLTDFPPTENPLTENPTQIKNPIDKERTDKEPKEKRDKVLSAQRSEPNTISYPLGDTVEPEKKFTRRKCVELFGEKATSDAKQLVDEYIDQDYPQYRGKEHPRVTHAARYAYVCRILRCAMEVYLSDLEFARESLLYALTHEKKYDPTIYLVTRPQVLGMWILESNSVDPSIANDPYYGQNPSWIKPLPDIDAIPEKEFKYFRENYQSR